MKPTQIFDILDLAKRARAMNLTFNPIFVGPPGIAKSFNIQKWCKYNDLPFIDVRIAYYEAPDMVGFPSIQLVDGRQRTIHALPEFWPTGGQGVLLLEEPNRGTTSVMNTMMQLLTDRKVGGYTLPPGWIICAAINPENEQYDVSTMDAALKDRFEFFNIEYDKQDFVSYIRTDKWDTSIINFVDTGTWTYVLPEDVSKNEGAKYISPRTLSKLNAALLAGIPSSPEDILERTIYDSVLGKIAGNSFYYFKHNAQPVLYRDLVDPKTYREAISKIKAFSDAKDYKAGTIAVTIRDIVEHGDIEDVLLSNVILALPADQSVQLISELDFKRGSKTNELLHRLTENYPEVKKYLKHVLKQK